MPASPRKNDPRPEDRRHQREHGAQSDQGGRPFRPLSSREKPEETVYEGAEESSQQRRS